MKKFLFCLGVAAAVTTIAGVVFSFQPKVPGGFKIVVMTDKGWSPGAFALYGVSFEERQVDVMVDFATVDGKYKLRIEHDDAAPAHVDAVFVKQGDKILKPVKATDKDGKDVLSKISKKDQDAVTLYGTGIELEFKAPAKKNQKEKIFLLLTGREEEPKYPLSK